MNYGGYRRGNLHLRMAAMLAMDDDRPQWLMIVVILMVELLA
jgi:hypothetical protein